MPDNAVTMAARAERAQEPGEGLRAVAELRGLIDQIEARQVDRALERRWSWAQVGRALGISKQAAHRRHAGRAPVPAANPASPAPAERGARVVITGHARAVVASAREAAARLGAAEVEPSHLLFALLQAPGGSAQDALLQLGIAPAAAREEIVTAAPRPGRRGPELRPQISAKTRRVLEDSLAESQRLCHGHLGPEHLLLALLRDEDGPAVELLTRLGATTDDVETAVCEVLKHADFARSL